MAEPELGKIIELIMSNPDLIEKIRALGEAEEAPREGREAEREEEGVAPISNEVSADGEKERTSPTPAEAVRESGERSNRNELLRALKPYVSTERGKAIESMMTIADILDLMRKK